jgi:hypothetical protein
MDLWQALQSTSSLFQKYQKIKNQLKLLPLDKPTAVLNNKDAGQLADVLDCFRQVDFSLSFYCILFKIPVQFFGFNDCSGYLLGLKE